MIKEERGRQLQDEFTKGKEAENLLANPAFKRSLDAVKADLIEGIIDSSWRQKRLREETYKQLRAMDRLVGKLQNEIETGKLAKKRLEAN